MVFGGPDLPRAVQLGINAKKTAENGLKLAFSKEVILLFDVHTHTHPKKGKKGRILKSLNSPGRGGGGFQGAVPCYLTRLPGRTAWVFVFVFVSGFFHDSSGSEDPLWKGKW